MPNAIENLIAAKLLPKLPQVFFEELEPIAEELVELRKYAKDNGLNLIIDDIPIVSSALRNGRVIKEQTGRSKKYTFEYKGTELTRIPKSLDSGSEGDEKKVGHYFFRGKRTFAPNTYGNVARNSLHARLHSNFGISDNSKDISASNSDNVIFLDTKQGVEAVESPASLFIKDGSSSSSSSLSCSSIKNSPLTASLKSSGLDFENNELVILVNSDGKLSVTDGENIYILNSHDITLLKKCYNLDIKNCGKVVLTTVGKSTFEYTENYSAGATHRLRVVDGEQYGWFSRNVSGAYGRAIKRHKDSQSPLIGAVAIDQLNDTVLIPNGKKPKVKN